LVFARLVKLNDLHIEGSSLGGVLSHSRQAGCHPQRAMQNKHDRQYVPGHPETGKTNRCKMLAHIRSSGPPLAICNQDVKAVGHATRFERKADDFGQASLSRSFWWIPSNPPLLKTTTTSPDFASGLSFSMMSSAVGS
jgi:hypothetical protein